MRSRATSSISIPLVVSLLGDVDAGGAGAYAGAIRGAFSRGAESLLGSLGIEARARRGRGRAPLPILLATLEDPALLEIALAAKRAAAGHDLRVVVLRVGAGAARAPRGADMVWDFPTASKDAHKPFDRLAAGAWLALRAQVRLFVGPPPARSADRLDQLTQATLPHADPVAFWEATARHGRLHAEELALPPFYDTGRRPFQPPVRRLDEAERGLVGRMGPREVTLLGQLGLPPEEEHGAHGDRKDRDIAWAREWVAQHLAPIARWNALPLDGGPVTKRKAWRNLWTADGALKPPDSPQGADGAQAGGRGDAEAPKVRESQAVRMVAAAMTRAHVARKALEERHKWAVRVLVGFAPWAGSENAWARSAGLLLGSMASASFFASVMFACYAKLYPPLEVDRHHAAQFGWALAFCAFAGIAAAVAALPRFREAKRFDEDLRALRETLRVQLFWWLARDPEIAADQFPRGHRGRLGAVRIAASNIALAALRETDWESPLTREEAERVRDLWVAQQARRLNGEKGCSTVPAEKQHKLAAHRMEEATVHGLGTGLGAFAVLGAAPHALALLGHQEWMPVHFGGPSVGIVLALSAIVAGALLRKGVARWLKHHGGLHNVPLAVGAGGGLLLVLAWMAFGAGVAPWLGGLRSGLVHADYWWVSGCVLAGLLAGVLHTRHALLNLGADLANAEASATIYGQAEAALRQLVPAVGIPADLGTQPAPGTQIDDDAHKETRRYLRELGRMALAENSRWLLDHRARPLALPHLT